MYPSWTSAWCVTVYCTLNAQGGSLFVPVSLSWTKTIPHKNTGFTSKMSTWKTHFWNWLSTPQVISQQRFRMKWIHWLGAGIFTSLHFHCCQTFCHWTCITELSLRHELHLAQYGTFSTINPFNLIRFFNASSSAIKFFCTEIWWKFSCFLNKSFTFR